MLYIVKISHIWNWFYEQIKWEKNIWSISWIYWSRAAKISELN